MWTSRFFKTLEEAVEFANERKGYLYAKDRYAEGYLEYLQKAEKAAEEDMEELASNSEKDYKDTAFFSDKDEQFCMEYPFAVVWKE